jgi:hypothetical protein
MYYFDVETENINIISIFFLLEQLKVSNPIVPAMTCMGSVAL